MVQTKVYVPLQSKGNAINAINEIADKMSLSNISFVVYDLAENHLVAASDDPHLCGGPRGVEDKYKLSSDTASQIRRDCRNGGIAVLAYTKDNSNVFLLDSVRDPMAASALMIVVSNVLLQRIMGGGNSFIPSPTPRFDAPPRESMHTPKGRYDVLIPNFKDINTSIDGLPLPGMA